MGMQGGGNVDRWLCVQSRGSRAARGFPKLFTSTYGGQERALGDSTPFYAASYQVMRGEEDSVCMSGIWSSRRACLEYGPYAFCL